MTLAEQLRAMGGTWDIKGIDRAQELADILTKNGITDLSQLKLNQGTVDNYYGSGGDAGEVRTEPRNTMSYGDRTFGTLAREGWDTTATRPLTMTNTEGDNILARSVEGKGAVTYQVAMGPNGLQIQPVWQSSGEEDAAKAAAIWAATMASMGSLGGAGLLGDSALAASQGTVFGAGGLLGPASTTGGLSAGGYGAAGDLGSSAALTGGLDLGGASSGLGSGLGAAELGGLSYGGYGLAGDLGSADLLTGGPLGTFSGAPVAGYTTPTLGVGGLTSGGYGLPGDMGSSELLTGGPLGTFSGTPVEGFATPTLGSGVNIPDVPDYSNEGRNYPTPESTQPGGGQGGAPGSNTSLPGVPSVNTPSTGNSILDWLKNNPGAALTGASLVGGLVKDANTKDPSAYDGPMPTISRGGWTPSVTPGASGSQGTGVAGAGMSGLTLPTTGVENSGLWRYAGSGLSPQNTTLPVNQGNRAGILSAQPSGGGLLSAAPQAAARSSGLLASPSAPAPFDLNKYNSGNLGQYISGTQTSQELMPAWQQLLDARSAIPPNSQHAEYTQMLSQLANESLRRNVEAAAASRKAAGAPESSWYPSNWNPQTTVESLQGKQFGY